MDALEQIRQKSDELDDVRVDSIDMDKFDKDRESLRLARAKKEKMAKCQKKMEDWFETASMEIDSDKELSAESKIAKMGALMLVMSGDRAEKLKGLEQLAKFNGLNKRSASGDSSDDLGPLIIEHFTGRTVEITPMAVAK